MIDPVTAVGSLAGLFTTLAFVPQFTKAWRSKSTKDISLGMFVIFTTGVVLWLIYGLMIQSTPVIVANMVTLLLAVGILLCKIRYG